MVICPIAHTDLKTSMFYIWLRLDGVCAVAGGRPKRLSGVSCLRSDGVLQVRIAADALSTFPASTWGLVLAKAVRSASSWGLVFGFKYGIGCE